MINKILYKDISNIYSYLKIFFKYCQNLLATFLLSVKPKNVAN